MNEIKNEQVNLPSSIESDILRVPESNELPPVAVETPQTKPLNNVGKDEPEISIPEPIIKEAPISSLLFGYTPTLEGKSTIGDTAAHVVVSKNNGVSVEALPLAA